MRIIRVSEMLGRDLARRRLTLSLIVALPVLFYFVQSGASDGDRLTSGGVGASWAIAGAALFSTLGARTVDQRLVLDGMKPVEILVGRALLLAAGGAALTGVLGVLMWIVTGPAHVGDMALGLVLVVVVAVPLGLTVGAIVPHELEGTLLIIAVIGIEISLGPHSAIVGALPLGGAQRIFSRAAGSNFSLGSAAARSVGWALILGASAAILFVWRVAGRWLLLAIPGAVVGAGLLAAPFSVSSPFLSSTTFSLSGRSRTGCHSAPLQHPAHVTDEGVTPPFFAFAITTATSLRGSDGLDYQVYAGDAIGVLQVSSCGWLGREYHPRSPVRLTGVAGDVVTFSSAAGSGRLDVVRGDFRP